MLYLKLFGAWVKGCQSQRGKRRPDESSLKKGRIGESLPGGHLHSWLSFETKVCLGMVTGTGQKMEKEKDGAYQELFPRGRDPWQCIRVWPLLFKVAES